jgi:hypothetical protein
LFWKAVEKFKQTKPTDKSGLKKKAQELHNTYIVDGAPREINLAGLMKKRIIESLSAASLSINTFDAAQQSVLHLMENDPFRRFKNTEAFRDYLNHRDSTPAPAAPNVMTFHNEGNLRDSTGTLGSEDSETR